MRRKRIEELVDILNKATVEYDKGNPIMTDGAWDRLYYELVKLEDAENYYLVNSPTQSIHFDVVSKLDKVQHNHKMLSLDKTKDLDVIKDFFGNHSFIAMSKLDGLTCSLRYLNGKLVSAETRGNGIEGEDILHNVKIIPSIPKNIDYYDELIIDGEIICTLGDFERFKNDYENPRNFAAGSIRLLNSKECYNRHLTFVAWDIIKGFDDINSLCAKLEKVCKELGFEIPSLLYSEDEISNINNNLYRNDLNAMIDDIVELSYISEYPIDGAVFKFDDIAFGKTLGETAHHFKNAIAYKFFDEEYSTELLGIDYTMGRTGILTPVARFNPVRIDGSTVERASLHNLNIMEELLGMHPYVNQKVRIIKSNKIIPQITSAEKKDIVNDDLEIISIPKICPICGANTEVVNTEGTKVLKCTNSNCESKLINIIDHFVGKKGLDIKGLSKATLEKLIGWGWVDNITDIFKLKEHEKEWIQKPGFGVKSVGNILQSIENGRTCGLANFICALGIPMIGATAAKELSKHFKTWESFDNAIHNSFSFYNLPSFGFEMDKNIKNFDYTEANILYNNYLTISDNISPTINNNILNDKVFVITGKLETFKNRNALQETIEELGGKVSSSVSSKTSYLINNDINSTSSKNKTAKSLGVPIITEINFIEKFLTK